MDLKRERERRSRPSFFGKLVKWLFATHSMSSFLAFSRAHYLPHMVTMRTRASKWKLIFKLILIEFFCPTSVIVTLPVEREWLVKLITSEWLKLFFFLLVHEFSNFPSSLFCRLFRFFVIRHKVLPVQSTRGTTRPEEPKLCQNLINFWIMNNFSGANLNS